jgi:hypothetical protein
MVVPVPPFESKEPVRYCCKFLGPDVPFSIDCAEDEIIHVDGTPNIMGLPFDSTLHLGYSIHSTRRSQLPWLCSRSIPFFTIPVLKLSTRSDFAFR